MKFSSKKSVLAVLFALLFILAACNSTDPDPTEEPEATETPEAVATEAPEETEEPEPEESTEPVDTSELSDDPYSFQFMLEGEIYTLPTPFAQLADDGWTCDSLDETLNPSSYTTSIRLEKGDAIVMAQFVNVTNDVQTFENCHVGQVTLDDYYMERGGAELVLPGGIVVGSSYDQVIAAYGQPSDESDTDSNLYLYFKAQSYQELDLVVDKETELVTKVTYRNLLADEDDEAKGSSAATGEVPDIVTDYTAPTALGDSWDSYTLSYADVVYGLPCPLSYFLENGWVFVDDDVEVAAQRSSSSIKLRYENSTISVYVNNYTDTAQPASNCFVTQIRHSAGDASLDILLPGGVGPGSSIDEVKAAWGEPDDIYESSSTASYTYGTGVWEKIEISFWESKDWGVASVTIYYAPKTLD